MLFRKATIEDADAVSEIYDLARESLKRNEIPQWQNGVPGRDTFLVDVSHGVSYVMEVGGEVIATIQIIENEPYYANVVDGNWRSNNALVAHRVAVKVGCRHDGVGSKLLEAAAKNAAPCAFVSINSTLLYKSTVFSVLYSLCDVFYCVNFYFNNFS